MGSRTERGAHVGRYAITIFLGAFLLFQVQPLLANYILPWFGGASNVWTACLLFFQALLVAGYAYADRLSRLPLPWQARLHLVALLASLLFLPITPSGSWRPEPGGNPVGTILLLLLVTVGGPYLLLSSTGPLLQSWFSRESEGRSPYRLYALSNAASLLGLLAYPFVAQPALDLGVQTTAWSAGYGLFVVSCAWIAAGLATTRPRGGFAPAPSAATAVPAERPPAGRYLLWIALPACASSLLLGFTNVITADLATVPFLWVFPLAVYLLTFILCFERPAWYSRRAYFPALAAVLAVNVFPLPKTLTGLWWFHMTVPLAGLFVCSMICHGELVRLRPDPRRLTGFYLSIAAGGAAGGGWVAVVAPAVFPGFWEVPLGLFACVLLVVALVYRERDSLPPAIPRKRLWNAVAVGLGVIGPALLARPISDARLSEAQARNFYGVLLVWVSDAGTPAAARNLLHGSVVHGTQFVSAERRSWPTTYYGPGTGISLAIEHHPNRLAGEPMRVGVVGLGAGTLATWAREGDVFRFYEIDPQVAATAQRHFTFLRDCLGSTGITLGDARISLERELDRPAPGYDILAVDAFSGGSIPAHLLTRECFAVYARALRPDGVLAVHVTNTYLDLTRVVRGAAVSLGMHAVRIRAPGDKERGTVFSEWVLVSGDRTLLDAPAIVAAAADWSGDEEPVVWTDRFGSLLQVLR